MFTRPQLPAQHRSATVCLPVERIENNVSTATTSQLISGRSRLMEQQKQMFDWCRRWSDQQPLLRSLGSQYIRKHCKMYYALKKKPGFHRTRQTSKSDRIAQGLHPLGIETRWVALLRQSRQDDAAWMYSHLSLSEMAEKSFR